MNAKSLVTINKRKDTPELSTTNLERKKEAHAEQRIRTRMRLHGDDWSVIDLCFSSMDLVYMLYNFRSEIFIVLVFISFSVNIF